MNNTLPSSGSDDFHKENTGVQNTAQLTTEADVIWSNFLRLLETKIKKSVIETWFTFLKPEKYEDNILTVTVPNNDIYGMIESRFNKDIDNVLKSLLGDEAKLKFEIAQLNLFSAPTDTHHEAQQITPSIKIAEPKTLVSNLPSENQQPEEPFKSNLYSKNTFENLVKGENNELAVSIAYAISNNPGKAYNPYFVFGGVGLGKTHLVQAIGNEVLKKYPEKKVYYTTASEFTNRFTDSIAQNKMDFSTKKPYGTKKLDAFYKSLDVLIIDDIQNLSGKTSTQDYFYQIFNYLFHEKKHIIFSSDKPINQILGIEERLLNRFQWGMVSDIQPPNWEMRVAIIKKKLEVAQVEVPDDIINFLATNVKDSIRTIEGCIAGMIAESTFIYKGEITLDIAEKVVNRVVGVAKRNKHVTLENILDVVSDYYSIQKRDILSKKRTKEIAQARQIAMFLAKEYTDMTLQLIGSFFNGKDHATVLYAVNTINKQIKADKKFAAQISHVKETLKNS
ncbi:MAG TPA: chromosomal replication initiator protein DnaA [Ignavibacteria bacterium]|nr:chromosomal replication initiator protein DnaA [Ignavibacteria bacterium]